MFFAALVLAGAFYLDQHLAQSHRRTPEPAANVPPPVVNSELAAASNTANSPIPAPAPAMAVVTAANAMTPEQRQAYIESETTRLQEWSTQDDPASFSGILNDLTNSEKPVRMAAIEAARQFGGSDAISVLRADAANAADTDEKIALLQAADFLSLPTIADENDQLPKTPEQIQAAQQSRERSAARRQFLMQKHAQINQAPPVSDQNSQPPQ